jgi:hypothetical protein
MKVHFFKLDVFTFRICFSIGAGQKGTNLFSQSILLIQKCIWGLCSIQYEYVMYTDISQYRLRFGFSLLYTDRVPFELLDSAALL